MKTLTERERLPRRYRSFQNTSIALQRPKIWDIALDYLGYRRPCTESLNLTTRFYGRGLLLIANHPCGVTDGVTLAWIASRIDPEFRIIANEVLRQEPLLNPNILAIRFQGSNSNLFQRASRLAIILSLGLYMHEIHRRLDMPIEFDCLPIINHKNIPNIPESALALWPRDLLDQARE